MSMITAPRNKRKFNNPANAISAEAKSKGKSYWAIAQKHGHGVAFQPNLSWIKHLIYQSKLEARRKHA